jgi:hypothetical protein
MEWIQGLLTNYGRNHGFLELYLDSYRRAAHSQLSASAAPVLTWLDQAAASVTTEPENQPEA